MLFSLALSVLLLALVHCTPCLPKGGCSSISESFESAKSSVSTASSSFQASSSSIKSMGGGGGSCSSFDRAYWQGIFEKCSYFSEIERECYLSWLASFSDESLQYCKSIADYFNIQEALKTDILDYALLQKDILAAYEFFNSKDIYSAGCELAAQKEILEEYAKSKLAQTLSCLDSSSPLYKLLEYSIKTDFTTLPCTVGFINAIVKAQKSYFSSSSSSSSSSNSVRSVGSSSSSSSVSTVSSSSSSFDKTQYQSILQAANIKECEYELYLNYLSKLASDKVCLFTDLINFFNAGSQVLTAEMILDFANLNQEIHALYKLLGDDGFFVSNADWLAKKAVLEEIKSKLSTALGYISKDCCLYSALQYCLETDTSYCPLFIGLSNYLLEQQCSYFSVSSSSSTTVKSTSSSSSCVCA